MLVTVVGGRLCWWLFYMDWFLQKSSQSNDSYTKIFILSPLKSYKLKFVTNMIVPIPFDIILKTQISWHHATKPLLIIKKAKMISKKSVCLKLAKQHVLISIQLKNFTLRKIAPTRNHFRFSKNIIPGLLLWNGGSTIRRKMVILVILFHLDHQEHWRAIKAIQQVQVATGKIQF